MSHGDSRFRCRKGGSAGGSHGKEARLFTRLKRAWWCAPWPPGPASVYPWMRIKRQRYIEQWAEDSHSIRYRESYCHIKATHPRDTPKRPRDTQSSSDSAARRRRPNRVHGPASTLRTQRTATRVGTQSAAPPSSSPDPGDAHALQIGRARARTAFSQTHRAPHTAQHPETGRREQPTTCAHTLPAHAENTASPRKGPRARTARPGRAPSPASAPQPGDPRQPATACRSHQARVAPGPFPRRFPRARGIGEDTPAASSASAVMDRLTNAPATSPASSGRSD